MPRIVLIGDSVFDNKVYVGDGKAVIEHLTDEIAGNAGWSCDLVAKDGDISTDVLRQVPRIPDDATHFFLSVGGNDALRKMHTVSKAASSVLEGLRHMADLKEAFERDYRATIDALLVFGKPLTVCSIYEPYIESNVARVNFGRLSQRETNAGLSVFNDVIHAVAFEKGLALIELRQIFTEEGDYANPIEPSVQGGSKLAKMIVNVMNTRDFTSTRTTVYVGPNGPRRYDAAQPAPQRAAPVVNDDNNDPELAAALAASLIEQ